MPEARAALVQELAEDMVKVRTSFDSVREVSFEAWSGKRGKSSTRLGMGLGAVVSEQVSFRVDYDLESYKHTSAATFAATLGVYW
jgi:hypothetical protein